jgi:2'-hydroxyisoflavone reductase
MSSAPFIVSPSANERALRVLVLGGTGFLGPAIVEYARAQGHAITLFNRGKTNPALFPDVEKLRGDRTPPAPDLGALQGSRTWDAVIDVWPSDPHTVAATARLLQNRVGRYIFVSSTVAYKDLVKPGAVETDALFDDVTNAAAWYEYDKAQCERVLQLVYAERHAVVRSHIINGYRNPSDSLRMWLVRLARGGEVLAPGGGDDPVQFTDVRDVAQFIVAIMERGLSGAYNVAGPGARPTSFRSLLTQLNAAVGNRASLTWVDEDFLEQQGVRPFSDLAMWLPVRRTKRPGFMQIDSAKARDAGLTFRPLSDTARDELRWFTETMSPGYEFGVPPSNKGFPRARETELLAAWRRR